MSQNNWGGKRSNQTGRPPLPAEKRRVQFATSICDEIYEAAKIIAAEKGLSLGQIIDKAVTIYSVPIGGKHYPKIKVAPYLAPDTASKIRGVGKTYGMGHVIDDALTMFLEEQKKL